MGHVGKDSGGESGRDTPKDEGFDINRDVALANITKGFLNDDIAKEKHEEEAEKAKISERFEFFSETQRKNKNCAHNDWHDLTLGMSEPVWKIVTGEEY